MENNIRIVVRNLVIDLTRDEAITLLNDIVSGLNKGRKYPKYEVSKTLLTSKMMNDEKCSS